MLGAEVVDDDRARRRAIAEHRAPDPRLKPFIIDYQGYRERAAGPMRRLQPPFDGIPMIVTFGPSIDIINGDRPAQRGLYRSFLAGLHDVHVFTEYQGAQMGFQVNFTLLGAYRFLSITMSDIANRVLDLGRAPRQVLLDDGLQVVDVVEEHLLDVAHRRLDVARHGDVDDEERVAPLPSGHTLDLRARDDAAFRQLLDLLYARVDFDSAFAQTMQANPARSGLAFFKRLQCAQPVAGYCP